MGRVVMLIGLVLLGLDRLAESWNEPALGLGLVLAGGFLHLGEQRE